MAEQHTQPHSTHSRTTYAHISHTCSTRLGSSEVRMKRATLPRSDVSTASSASHVGVPAHAQPAEG